MKKNNKIKNINDYEKSQQEFFHGYDDTISLKRDKEFNHFNKYSKTNCDLGKIKNN